MDAEQVQAAKASLRRRIFQLADLKVQRQERRLLLERRMEESNVPEEARDSFRAELQRRETRYLRVMRQRINVNSFEKVQMLGKGAFGAVWLVKEKSTGKVYAMKQLNKAEMIRRGQIEHCKTERNLMSSSLSQWVIQLHYSFQDEDFLYLVMDFAIGGDLMGLLIRVDIMPEPVAKFYFAEAAMCLNEIHSTNCLYRDVKPDNFLIMRDGHLRLSDFGLAKQGDPRPQYDQEISQSLTSTQEERLAAHGNQMGIDHCRLRAFSTVGTPDYSAIEVLRRDPGGSTYKSDIWGLGVILFESLFGYPPFSSESAKDTCRKILNYKRFLIFPAGHSVSREAIDLICHLICEPEDRYDFAAIKKHPWLADVDWDRLREYQPPFRPQVSSDTDTRYFDFVADHKGDQDSTAQEQEALKRAAKKEIGGYTDEVFKGYSYRAFPGTLDGRGMTARTRLSDIFGSVGGLAGVSSSTSLRNQETLDDIEGA